MTKEKLFTCYIRSSVIYACEKWSTTMNDENQLLYFEKKVLRNMYKPTRNSITEEYENRKNADLNKLYNKPSIKNMSYVKRLE